jgi:hypothetical protein
MGAFERRAGIAVSAAVPTTSARAACDEYGALSAFLARMLGNPRMTWPMLTEARASSGGMARLRRSPNRLANAVAPIQVRAYLEEHPAEDPVAERDAAALALAGTLGLPVTMSSHLKTAEFTPVWDSVAEVPGVVIGYQVREDGGLKVRRATTTVPDETIWTAASSVAIATYFVPWWRQCRDRGDEYVFPRISTKKKRGGGATEYSIHGDEPVATADLQSAVKRIRADASWHCMRFGVARALVGVHQVPDGPVAPVALDVKNTLQLRSNAKLLGSNDAYILDDIDPLFDATRALDRVPIVRLGGLASTSGRVQAMPGEFAIAGDCFRCASHMALDAEGYVCSYPSCDRVVCEACTTGEEKVGDAWCPAHAPTDE